MTELERCREVEDLLFDRDLSRSERQDHLGRLGDVRDCILAGLTATAEAEDWARFDRWLFAAFLQPSTTMTGLLCTVLSRRDPEINNEDVVDVLAAIGDPAAVGPIEDAMLWEPDWDEFGALAVKCVWALGAIGTAEARLVLEDAATVGPEMVRSHAEHQLDVLRAR